MNDDRSFICLCMILFNSEDVAFKAQWHKNNYSIAKLRFPYKMVRATAVIYSLRSTPSLLFKSPNPSSPSIYRTASTLQGKAL